MSPHSLEEIFGDIRELGRVTNGVEDVNTLARVRRTGNHDGQNAITCLPLARVLQRLSFFVGDVAYSQKK